MAFHWQLSAGLQLLKSSLLTDIGITHAFTTRIGGVSEGAYNSLNLDHPETCPEEERKNVGRNYRLLAEALGVPDARVVKVKQMHGCDVVSERAHNTEADGLLTDRGDCMLTVRTADCVPILLASDDGSAVGAVHAGWRGVVAGVIGRAVEAMGQRYAVAPTRIVAAIGPSISMSCFEVGPEVLLAFHEVNLKETVYEEPNTKPHIDLKQAVALQLERAGLSLSAIDVSDHCTVAMPRWYYSHRRDKGITGRNAAAIMPNV